MLLLEVFFLTQFFVLFQFKNIPTTHHQFFKAKKNNELTPTLSSFSNYSPYSSCCCRAGYDIDVKRNFIGLSNIIDLVLTKLSTNFSSFKVHPTTYNQ